MLKKGLMISAAVLLLSGCGSLKGMMREEPKPIPPAPILESLVETDSGPAMAFNDDDPGRPIAFRTERHGIYIGPADAAELLIWMEQIESR